MWHGSHVCFQTTYGMLSSISTVTSEKGMLNDDYKDTKQSRNPEGLNSTEENQLTARNLIPTQLRGIRTVIFLLITGSKGSMCRGWLGAGLRIYLNHLVPPCIWQVKSTRLSQRQVTNKSCSGTDFRTFTSLCHTFFKFILSRPLHGYRQQKSLQGGLGASCRPSAELLIYFVAV